MQEKSIPPGMLTKKDAAIILHTSTFKINQLIKHGELMWDPKNKYITANSVYQFQTESTKRIRNLQNTILHLDDIGLSLDLIEIVVSNVLKGETPVILKTKLTPREFMYQAIYQQYKEEKDHAKIQ